MIKNQCEEILVSIRDTYNKVSVLMENGSFTDHRQQLKQYEDFSKLNTEFEKNNIRLNSEYQRIEQTISKKQISTETDISLLKSQIAMPSIEKIQSKTLKLKLKEKKNKLNIYKAEAKELANYVKTMSIEVKSLTKGVATIQKNLFKKTQEIIKIVEKEQRKKRNTEINRHYLSYPKFQGTQDVGLIKFFHEFMLKSFFAYDLHTNDEPLRGLLQKAFEGVSFQVIIESLAMALNLDPQEVLIIYTKNGSLRFKYEFNKDVNEDMRLLDARFDFNHSKAWYFSDLDHVDSDAVARMIGNHFKAVIDLDSETLLFALDSHPEKLLEKTIPLDENIYLPTGSVVFTYDDFVNAFDTHVKNSGAFLFASRGLSLYDPIQRKFVKFNPSINKVITPIPTLIFRLSFGSYYNVYVVSTETKEITANLYKKYLEVISQYRKKYWLVTPEQFTILNRLSADC